MSRQQILKRTPNNALFYSSLLGVIALSLSSYYLSYIASNAKDSLIGLYTVTQYCVMAGFMLLAWKSSPQSSNLFDYRCLLVVAIIARVAIFDVDPYASNDVDRYLFDGRIAVEGLDPYRISHDAPELKELRQQWQPPAEHAKYVTLYPPVALGFFAIAAATGIANALLVWKLILLTAGLLTVWITAKVLQHANKLEHLPLVALSPLLILETHVGLHLDALSTLAVISALYCWQRHWIIWTGVVIGLGTLVKVLPIMLLLPLIFTMKSLRQAATLVMTALLVIVSVYLLTITLGIQPIGSIGVFFEKWRFGAPLFVLLDNVFSGQEVFIVMVILSSVITSAVAYFCWQQRHSLVNNNVLLFGSIQLVLALPLIVSPVTFPWYLMPIVPLMALYPNRYLMSWILLLPFTYEVIGAFITHQVWQPAQWPLWSIGLLQFLALLALMKYGYRMLLNTPKLATTNTL